MLLCCTGPVLHFCELILSGDPFTHGTHLVSYTAFSILTGLRKSCQEKDRRSGSVCLSTQPVNEEMFTDTKIPLRVLQSTQKLDMLGLEQESLFSSWDMYGFCCDLSFKFQFTMPLWGSRSKPSSWGLSWHWSDHLDLFCSYISSFVT